MKACRNTKPKGAIRRRTARRARPKVCGRFWLGGGGRHRYRNAWKKNAGTKWATTSAGAPTIGQECNEAYVG